MQKVVDNQTSFSPLFTKLLAKRGFEDPHDIDRFLSSNITDLKDPFLMKGMQEAVERIQEAVRNQEKILVHGDYDIDGITGATLLGRMLARVNAEFEIFLPDRKEDGYGVSLRAIEEAQARGFSIIMTVDCGITARDQIIRAKELGLDVIVIDHHRIPEEGIPPATVILNPLQEDCPYPFKDLSAAGLALKLAQALLGESALEYLDLAALSTIGDVAPLKDENRVIVKHGLKVLSERKNPGIKALANVSNIKQRQMNVGHVGFILGPRINAAGRMSTPQIAQRLLMTESAKEAASLASVLDEENKARQKEERATTKEAIKEVENTMNFSRDRVIVVGKQGWHAGVIGIVASRLVERFYRPALVIAFDGETGKASARSIKGFHLFNALNDCKDSLLAFGGHEQAAGFSIEFDKLEELRRNINHYAHENYEAQTFIRSVKTDLEISFSDLSSTLVKELPLMEPHGAGNARPTFLTKNVQIKGKVEKKYTNSYRFYLTDGNLTLPASWYDKTDGSAGMCLEPNRFLEVAYSVKIQSWDGIDSLTLEVKGIKPQT